MRISDWSSDVCSSDLTRYHFDEFQQTYFVIAGSEALLRATEETDFASVYRRIAAEAALEPGDAWPGDLAYEGHLPVGPAGRSEEHTSELPSLMRISYAVFCLKYNQTSYSPRTSDQ